MDKLLLIEKARALATPSDLLNLLNEIKADLVGDKSYPFTKKQLFILCNPNNDLHRYCLFSIPKKSGGVRNIYAPSGNLKWFQRCLNELFKALYIPSPYATGFTAGKSIVDNALMHTNQNYVFNIDLKDFFPSIAQARVWKRLQLAPFNFNARIAGLMAGLCSIKIIEEAENDTYRESYVLPQGAPTSPLLTNAICDTLDRKLHGLAKRFGLHYSRYADDITFSSMHNVYRADSDFRKELERIIAEQRFTINDKKTRLNHCSTRQEVTGLTVGHKINVTRKYVKDIRAILHIWEKYGINAAYAAFFPRYQSEKFQQKRGCFPNIVNVISGKLCYLKMVKGDKDPVYVKLYSQFARLTDKDEHIQNPKGIDYLFTMPLSLFESKLGITLEYRHYTYYRKKYACFVFQDRLFKVAISRNIDATNIPADAQISLTRMRVPDDKALSDQPTIRVGYILHKPLGGYRNEYAGNAYMNEIDITANDNLLSRLIDSNFDLSILP